jgi:NADPH-dependent 2,4-dienoyl-CoA reductase/sulfur reductase-like enzyme
MGERLIVIGGTAAGLSAASKAKRLRQDLDVLVFERTGYISYGACGLPYFVGDLIQEPLDLVTFTVPSIKEKRDIEVKTHHEVVKIDRQAKQVEVVNLDTNEKSSYAYDKLVIATGASPVIPKVKNIDAPGIYYLRTVEDGIVLKNAVEKGKKVAIVGGGFIGLEMAEEMTHRGAEVSLYETMPRLLPFLPESFSAQVLESLQSKGVSVHLNSAISGFETKDMHVSAISTINGESHACDLALVSIGVMPATSLARDCGLALGFKDGIVVDDSMQTSDKNIWACGDCVVMKHIITGKDTYIPLGTTANKQGKVAGGNIGGEQGQFPGVLGSMVTKIFDTYIAATGLSLDVALKNGYSAVEKSITKSDRASYYPGGGVNRINLVVDSNSGRVLGAQAVGTSTVAGRINTLVAVITAKMHVDDLENLDLVYAPPVAPVYDPLLIAASQAKKLVRR